jgi:hypothetical protein
MNPEDKVKALIEAIKIKEKLRYTENEMNDIRSLIRNLPLKKKKLSKIYDDLNKKYNELIDKKNLPLKKVI